MDMTTLKSLIIELKDNSGLTYQEISDELREKYGVIRTRQAVGSLYKRAKEANNNSESFQPIVCDIINIYCISDTAVQTHDYLAKSGVNISYQQVLDIVNREQKYISSVKNTIIANIENMMCNTDDIRDIRKVIEYKGIPISTKRFNEYMEAASELYIKHEILSKLNRVYRMTANKQMVKNVGEKFNLGIKTADLR